MIVGGWNKRCSWQSYSLLWILLFSVFIPAFGEENDDYDAPALATYYGLLHKKYIDSKITSDCKVESDEGNDDHLNWGTKETLEFLAGKRSKMSRAEGMMVLPKLRKFMARVGYLKDPGSLVFLDKQTQTMKLTGCGEDAVWRQQGVPGHDLEFQVEHVVAKKLKALAPSGFSYIHKYTCFHLKERCSHTYYVITKMLPEMPLGLLVRNGQSSPDYGFTCNIPYCRLKNCTQPGEKKPLSRKSYPPFKISWVFRKENENDWKNVTATDNLKIDWEDVVTKNKEASIDDKDSYVSPDKSEENEKIEKYDWLDGFGEFKGPPETTKGNQRLIAELPSDNNSTSNDTDNNSTSNSSANSRYNSQTKYDLHSRIKIHKGTEDEVGVYECVIEDANGIVSTPNHMFETYRGKAQIHLIPDYLKYSFVVMLGCFILVFLIVLICPKKIEHDDGTRYSKDELDAPAADEDVLKPTVQPSPPSE